MPALKRVSVIVIPSVALIVLLMAAFSVLRGSKDVSSAVYPPNAPPDQPYLVYQGASDASAAVALDEFTFALADDEDNRLRVFRADSPGQPVSWLDLGDFLKPEPADLEADIEGAAMLGSRIYWLTSHDTNKRGELEPGRDYFFATDVSKEGHTWKLTPAGTPSRVLINSLLESPAFRELNRATGTKAHQATEGKKKKKEQEATGPAVGPVSLEGLCASPDGRRLFMGFRQPRLLGQEDRIGRALVIPLENPREIVDQQAAPVFGDPQALDLGGLVIRSMEYSPAHDAIFIIAGPEKKGFTFILYRWDGLPSSPPIAVGPVVRAEDQVTPEALVPFPSGKLFVICDDGDVIVDMASGRPSSFGAIKSMRNKELPDPSLKRFRVLQFNLDAPAPLKAKGGVQNG